jgi:hypothetical protein
MRILVLAQSRSGSTSLSAWLKSETGEEVMLEPFNPHANTEEQLAAQLEWVNSDRGLILKFVDNMFLQVNAIESVDWLMSKFDKVIGLTREDDDACAYSRLVAHLANDYRGSADTAEVDNMVINQNADLLSSYKTHAATQKAYIRNLDIFQITFEELYEQQDASRLIEYLGITPTNLDYLFENKNQTNNWNI